MAPAFTRLMPAEELKLDKNGKSGKVPHQHYTWMNSSYVFGARLTNAFAEHGWCTAIRGAEGGGKVTGLATHNFISDDGDMDMKCPTEIGITDRREAELSKQGFLPLCHYKNTDYAVFFGAQTTQKPKLYDEDDATANAEIPARLPYLMATSYCSLLKSDGPRQNRFLYGNRRCREMAQQMDLGLCEL